MQFSIVPLYFYEFYEDQKIATVLAEEMSVYFLGKDFGRIKTIYSRIVCLPEQLSYTFEDQPLIIHRKQPVASFAFHLDFDRFRVLNQVERRKYLIQEYLFNIEKFSKLKKSTGVTWSFFLNDLHLFVEQALRENKA